MSQLSNKVLLSLQEQAETSTEGATGVPRFKVDLDEKPEVRWAVVVKTYKQELLAMRSTFREEIAGMLGNSAFKILDSIGSLLGSFINYFVKYGQEVKGIAALSGIPVKEILIIQFMYEACSACTSIVLPGYGPNGEPCHIRTMDWEMPTLKALTIEVEFWKSGAPLFVSTTWPGYVGILTGMKPNAFSAAVNFRVTGAEYLQNVKNMITYSWPIGFLLRAVLEEDISYTQAVISLSSSQLVAPVYFTCCGLTPQQGCIITRDRKIEVNRWSIEEHGPAVQSNIDHWSFEEEDDILYSIERRARGRSLCEELQFDDDITKENMFGILSTNPILNSLTVSATWMCAFNCEFETRLPNGNDGFQLIDDPATFGGEERVYCASCKRRFNPNCNLEHQCSHVGDWHSTFSACGFACAKIGPRGLGKCHWSCCFTSDKNSPCKKSSFHVVPSDNE